MLILDKNNKRKNDDTLSFLDHVYSENSRLPVSRRAVNENGRLLKDEAPTLSFEDLNEDLSGYDEFEENSSVIETSNLGNNPPAIKTSDELTVDTSVKETATSDEDEEKLVKRRLHDFFTNEVSKTAKRAAQNRKNAGEEEKSLRSDHEIQDQPSERAEKRAKKAPLYQFSVAS